jgi:hypothetical protein
MADIIAMRVFAMLKKFDAMAKDWAFVQASDKAFHHLAGTNFEPANATYGRRV